MMILIMMVMVMLMVLNKVMITNGHKVLLSVQM